MTFPARIVPRLLFALLCSGAALVARADTDARFTSTLNAAQRERAGLTQLTADNLAIIDGLVRQDDTASKFKDNDVDVTRFSERHTSRERDLAGLALLTPPQVAVLDNFIGQRYVPAPHPASGFVATTAGARAVGVKPTLSTNKPEIHGEISFTQGWSKGGSFTGGDIVLTYADPAGRYAIAVGYGEYRGRGTMAPGFFPGYGPYYSYPDPFPTWR